MVLGGITFILLRLRLLYNRKTVLLTQTVRHSTYSVVVHLVGLVEFLSIHKGHGVQNDVGMDVVFIHMSCDHRFIPFTEKFPRQFHADLVGNLWRNFSRLETLLKMIGQPTARFIETLLGIVHLLRGTAPIVGRDKKIHASHQLAVLGLSGIHDVLDALAQVRLNRPNLRLRHPSPL